MRVLIVLYDGFTEYEYQIPLLALHHFSIPFDVVGLESKEVNGMMGLKASLAKSLDEIGTSEYTALFLPGIDYSEREKIAENERLRSLIWKFDQTEKLIAAVCAAPVFLGKAGVLKGKKFCSDVSVHNAFEGATQVQESAIKDEHILTGLGSRIYPFTALLIDALAGQEKSQSYRAWAGI